MAKRFVLRADDGGSFTIIDVFTGMVARYFGRELTRIPADMADRGLLMLNEMEQLQFELTDAPLVNSRRVLH